MKNDLNWYTRIYDDFLPDELCEEYVDMFELTMRREREMVEKEGICVGPIRPDGHQICGNCNCQRMNPMAFDRFTHANKLTLARFRHVVEQYKTDVNLHHFQWPKEFGYEEFRIKRFLVSDGGPDAEQFKEHSDVFSHESAKRFLIMMVYLNDDFEGGETVFPTFDDTIKAKKGSLVIFPPLWTYLHRGNPPLKPGYAKYFLMTYLSYTDLEKARFRGR